MGKDTGCRVGKGVTASVKAQGQPGGPGGGHRVRGQKVVALGGPELRDLLKPEEAPKGSGQALSRGQHPPSWLHLAQAALTVLLTDRALVCCHVSLAVFSDQRLDPRHVDPRHVDFRRVDPQCVDPWHVDFRRCRPPACRPLACRSLACGFPAL